MVRAGAVVDKIGVVSAYFGEGLGQVMRLFGGVCGAVVPGDVTGKLFGERQVVVVSLNPRELLVIAGEVTI
jgi:hypothetical protein